MVVETCRACASGNGPSETTHQPKATMARPMVARTIPAMRRLRRLTTPSWPGLSRPSTSSSFRETDVDARDQPGHDEELFLDDAVILPDGPRPRRVRGGHSSRGLTCS